VCEQCGEVAEGGQKEPRNSGKAQPVEAGLPAKAVISEDKHEALLAILQAAGGQLGLDLQSMLGPMLPRKATPEQQETRSFRALKDSRVEASKARAALAKAGKNVDRLEAELQKAREAQAAAKEASAKAEEELDEAYAKYQTAQADKAEAKPEDDGSGGGQEQDGPDVDMGAGDSEAAKGLQQQIEETLSDLRCKREKLQELKGAKKARTGQSAGGSEDASKADADHADHVGGSAAKAGGGAASAESRPGAGAGGAKDKPGDAKAKAEGQNWS